MGFCTDPAIAAAGPVVLASDGRIKEAGVAIPDGIPLFFLHGHDAAHHGPLGFGASTFNVSAVSDVVATPTATLERLGGLRAEMGDLALIDYCLRALQSGMRVVTVPDARVRVIEDDHTINDLPAIWRLRRAWRPTFPRDPYYNPNFRQDRGDFQLAQTRRST